MAYPASLTAVLPGGSSARSPSPIVWGAAKDPATTQTYAVDASKTLAALGGIINGDVTVTCTRGVTAGTPTVSGSEIRVSLSGGTDGGYATCQFSIPLSAGGVVRPVVYLLVQAGAQLVSGGVGSGTPGGGSTGGGTAGGTTGGGTTGGSTTGGGTTATPIGSLSGVPTAATAGSSLSGVTYTLANVASATVAILSGGATVSQVTVSGTSGTVPAMGFPGAAGTATVQLKDAASGNTLYQTTVTVNAASTGGSTTTPPGGSLTGVPANAAAGASLSGVTYTLTGTATGSVAILSGGVVQSSVAVSGASGTVPGMTFPGAAGQAVVQLRDGSGNALWQTTVTLAAASTGGTATPGATISGPSAAAVAGQAATFLVGFTGGLTSAYLGLLSGGVPTGARVAVSAGGLVSIAVPSAAGSYSAAVFSATTGGTKYAETPVFTVSAAAATGGTGGTSTTPSGAYVKAIAPATDGSGRLIATLGDGTASDLTAAVQGAVALDAVDAVAVDFPTAVTAVVSPPLACTGSVNFKTANHHGKTLTFGAGGTLALAAPADAVPGSWCDVLNTDTGASQVALGAGVVSAGGNTVAPGQSVRVTAAAGPDGVVRLYAATSLSNQATAQTLSFAEAVANQIAGNAFTVKLSYTNGTPSGLEWATSRTGTYTVATGAAIADTSTGNGSASFLHPGLASSAAAYTLYVRDRGHTDVVAVSNAFSVTAPASTGTTGGTTPAPTPTISVNTPAGQTAGAAFTLTGTYTGTAPTALDASINGGSTWQAVTATISGGTTGSTQGGTYSFPISISPAGTYAVRVRDRNNTAVVGASGTFTVAAAAATGGTTPPAYVGPLDSYTSTWTGLYSTARRLRSAYAGPAVRVRRSSDGTERDIGFVAAGGLDTAALTAFVGSGDGFVSKWYDQSGAGRDAVDTSLPNQPKLVAAGTVQTMAGKPAVRFVGLTTDNALVAANLPAMTGSSFFVMAAFQAASLGDYGRLCSFYKDDASAGGLFFFVGAELTTQRWSADGSYEAIAKAYHLGTGTPYVADAEYTGTEARVNVSPDAGLIHETAGFSEGFGAAGGQFAIGSALTGNPDEAFDGWVAEFAMSHGPAAGERANLAANMRAAFGVAA